MPTRDPQPKSDKKALFLTILLIVAIGLIGGLVMYSDVLLNFAKTTIRSITSTK